MGATINLIINIFGIMYYLLLIFLSFKSYKHAKKMNYETGVVLSIVSGSLSLFGIFDCIITLLDKYLYFKFGWYLL